MTDKQPQTTAGTCPLDTGGRREDCAAWPACACAPRLKIDREKLWKRIVQDSEAGFDGNCEAGMSAPQTTARPTSERDALAARYFPERWAEIVTKPGAAKARQNLRIRAERLEMKNRLQVTGACCGTCASFRNGAPYPGSRMPSWCSRFSDFQGYSFATADGLCLKWSDGNV